MRTVKFYTLGCKVNQYETQSIREQFAKAGFQEPGDSCPADIYVVNTCTVTHRADTDSLNLIRRAKRENTAAEIIVTGCLAELDEDKIKGIDGIGFIVKNKDKENILTQLLGQSDRTEEPKSHRNKYGISYFKGHTRAFLKIQDGCDNCCSYCKVHIARGRSRSRPLNEIIQEAYRLVKNGFKEIVLCGICLGSYGKDLTPRLNLIDVVSALEDMQGLLRIRLSSIELLDVHGELINKISVSKKLCRHLHIPLQSGDDEILAKMNRRYCREDYLKLINEIKSKIPDIAITTDVLVGFPGEGDSNFKNTVELVKEILPLKVHIFPYSRRSETESFAYVNEELPQSVVKQRFLQLKQTADICAFDYKNKFLNKTLFALIERETFPESNCWYGLTGNYIKVLVRANRCLENELISVQLKRIVNGSVLSDFS